MWRDDAADDGGPWPWLLRSLGYTVSDTWATGRSWRLEDAYVVLESGEDHVRGPADRRRTGMNHLALRAGTRDDVDALTTEAPAHGWRLLFTDTHPYAGGPHHYAAYLEDAAGFEVELVAEDDVPRGAPSSEA
nr:VOC family protein [Cellulomonas sp. APG4]